ncbi:MAG: peptidylprolyl isomerase [Pseudomonadota bacterium]
MSGFSRLITPFATAALIGLSSPTIAADSDEVLATVNGKEITQNDYKLFLQENRQQGALGEQQVIDELISRELVYQDALAQGLDESEDVQKQIERMRANIILSAALAKAMQKNPVSDKELKSLYDKQVEKFNVTEYKARHILLENKEDAEKVITELDMGADFAELAKKHSTGPSSKQGGDLGWFAPQQMVPEFSKEVAAMEQGKYTKQPVETQFGWHVIKLEDTRSAEPPAFDAVKQQLTKQVQQQHLNDYLKSLRSKADINVK